MAGIKDYCEIGMYIKLPPNQKIPQMIGQNSQDHLPYQYLTYHVNLTRHAKDDILIQS